MKNSNLSLRASDRRSIRKAARFARPQNKDVSRRWLRLERLEDRNLLATLFVDNPGDFVVTNDADASGGATNGDTVTFSPGAGSQHGAAVPNLTFGTDAFGSIQAAVNAATAGDTIRVGPGTFNEAVNVSKQLFVFGNQVDADAQTGRVAAAESIVDGGGGTPFNVGVSDVVINGFTIQGGTNAATGFGVTLIAGTSGSEIRNNILQNNIAGLSLANASASNQTIITGNLFQNNNSPGPVSGTAIYTDQFNAGGALTNVLIDNNTFNNNSNAAVIIGPTDPASPASNLTISRNIMTANGNAVLLFNTSNSTITQNEISGSTGSQIVIGGGDSGIGITQNFVTGGATNGIRVADVAGAPTALPNSNVTINRNSISGNATAGLNVEAGGYTGGAGSLNAEFNWWGSATGPTIASNPSGTGDAIIDAAGQVDYVPFLTNGTDTQPAVRGFQPSIADLSITKTDSPDPVVPGTTLTYTIIVTNNGPDTQTGATVADTFPAGFTGVAFTSATTGGATGNTSTSGNINDTVTMPSGSTITYTVTGTVSPSASGTLTNTATVTAPVGTFETNTANNTSTATTTVGAPQGDLSITKTDGVATAVPGSTLTYTIVVSNAGPSNVTGATVTDTFPATLTGVTFTATPTGGATGATAGSGNINQTVNLPAGSTVTYTVTGTVSSTATGTLSNTATVTATVGTDLIPGNNSATDTDTLTPQVDLAITKTDGAATEIPGTSATYTIVVSNTGPSTATGATVTDTFPASFTGATYTATPSGGATGATAGSGNINQTVTLPSGSSITYIVTGTISSSATGTLSNTATVTAAGGTTDTNPGNNSATDTDTLTPQTDLSVTKTDTPDPVNPGQNLTYTITVGSAGSSDAENVVLSDILPAGTTFVSATAPAGWTLTTPAVGGTGTVTATHTGSLPANSAAQSFVVVVNVASTVTAGTTISNTATVSTSTTDTNPANNSATATTTVLVVMADLTVSKTGPDNVSPGHNVIYTIAVHNNGPDAAQNVSFNDVLPANTTFVSLTQNSGPAYTLTTPPSGGTGAANGTIASFNSGATATFTLIVNLDSSAAIGDQLTNSVTVTTTTAETNTANNTDSTTSDIAEAALECEVTTLNSPGSQGTASIQDDADNPGENVLIVTGTNKNDVIVVEPQPKSKGMFRVVQNKRVIVTFISTDVPRIVVFGLAGNDTIVINGSMTQSAKLFGNEGNDVITGGRGDDGIDGGAGNDKLFGGAGNDTLCGGTGIDQVFGGLGDDTVGGDAGNDKLYGEAGNDLIIGGDGNDFLYGSIGNDRLYGQAGNDQLFGDAGNDVVVGGDGNDILHGGAGRDVLIGGTGKDTLYGDAGDDLLISGSTANDEDDAALQALLAAWAANDSYANRVNNIRTFAGPDAVTDDGVVDTLYGGANQDWFIVGSNDKIKDRAKNEQVN